MKSLYIEPQLGSRVLVLSVDLEAVEEEGGDEAFAENWQEKKGSSSDLHGNFYKQNNNKDGLFFCPRCLCTRSRVHIPSDVVFKNRWWYFVNACSKQAQNVTLSVTSGFWWGLSGCLQMEAHYSAFFPILLISLLSYLMLSCSCTQARLPIREMGFSANVVLLSVIFSVSSCLRVCLSLSGSILQCTSWVTHEWTA